MKNLINILQYNYRGITGQYLSVQDMNLHVMEVIMQVEETGEFYLAGASFCGINKTKITREDLKENLT